MTAGGWLLLLMLAAPFAARAQSEPEVPAIAPPRAAAPATPAPAAAQLDPARIGTPAIAPAPRPRVRNAARSRPRDPRDRAYMDGGVPGGTDVTRLGVAPAAPRAELAPRPNLDLEGPRAVPRAAGPSLQPTLIHPRLPGRSEVQDGGVTQRENRLLQAPAPGARFSVPMAW